MASAGKICCLRVIWVERNTQRACSSLHNALASIIRYGKFKQENSVLFIAEVS